jgi:hypothetical protein
MVGRTVHGHSLFDEDTPLGTHRDRPHEPRDLFRLAGGDRHETLLQ